MPYMMSTPAIASQLCPDVEGINPDGSRFVYTDGGKYWSEYFLGARQGITLTDSSYPPLNYFPHFAKIVSGHKKLPDIFRMDAELCISELMRSIIDRIEPSVHQFLKITILRKDGSAYPSEFFLFNICQVADSIVFEESNLHWADSLFGRKFIARGLARIDYRTLDISKIQGKHVWREKKLLEDMYFSDEIHSAFKDAKISGLGSIAYNHYFKVSIKEN